MHSLHLKELKNLINLSYVAIDELDRTVDNIVNGDFCRNMNLAWHHINGLLIYTARISRILWSDGSSEQRAITIRRILSISADSIFNYQNRNVRNDFDHIDERIDDIKNGKLNLGQLDLNIGNIDMMIGNKGVGDYMRHYDPSSRIIYFGCSSLSIPDLIVELQVLENEVKKQLK